MRRLAICFAITGLFSALSATAAAAEPLKITVEVPKEAPALDEYNKAKYQITIKMENTTKEDLILWPYISAEMTGPDGKAVTPSRRLGRWGVRPAGAIIESIQFITIRPGESWEVNLIPAQYFFDPEFITGWKLETEGEYTLRFQFKYDRAAVKKRFGEGAKELDDAKQKWNQALEIDKKFEAKFKVVKGP